MDETKPSDPVNKEEAQEQEQDRRSLWLVGLLLLLSLCCLFSSSQLAIVTGISRAIGAAISFGNLITPEPDLDEMVIGQLKPEIAAEATRDARALFITPDVTRGVPVVYLPASPTPTLLPPTVTNTPRPTFTPTPADNPPDQLPDTPLPPPIATATSTPLPSPLTVTPPPTAPLEATSTPTTIVLPTETATSAIPPTPTATATATGVALTATPTGTSVTPTIAPTPTDTPTIAPTPTDTPTVAPTPTDTPTTAPTPTDTPTTAPTPTDTPTTAPTPTDTPTTAPIPTDTPTTVPTPTNTPVYAIDISPDRRKSAAPGESVVYAHTVTNNSTVAVSVTITYLSNPAEPEYSTSITPTNLINLGPGASRPVTATINTPTLINVTQFQGTSRITATIDGIGTNDAITDTVTLINPSLQLNAAAGDNLVSLGWLTVAGVISYEVEYSANGGPWSSLVVVSPDTVDRYYHTPATNGSTYDYQLKAYNAGGLIGYSNFAQATPGALDALNNCEAQDPSLVRVGSPPGTFSPAACLTELSGVDSGIGTDNGLVTIIDLITQTNSITLSYGSAEISGIVDGPEYDLVFHTPPAYSGTITGTYIAYTTIEVSEDGDPNGLWIPIFSWDGNPGGVLNSNVSAYATDANGEGNDFIPASDLQDVAGQPFWNTGITIDIQPFAPAGIHYRYIRISPSPPAPAYSTTSIDTIYRVN